jgi:exopolysaccharide biosynthesis polyprenyl glycosylphosphotransferase
MSIEADLFDTGDERGSAPGASVGAFRQGVESVKPAEAPMSLLAMARRHKGAELARAAELAAEAVASGLDADEVLGLAAVRPLHQLRPVPPRVHSLTDRRGTGNQAQAPVYDPFSARRRQMPDWLVRYTVGLVVADVAAVGVAVSVALRTAVPTAGSVATAVAFVLLWPLLVASAGGYAERRLGTGTAEYRRVLLGGLLGLSALSVASVALPQGSLRPLVLVAAPLAAALTLICRAWMRTRLHAARRSSRMTKKVVVVGREASVVDLIRRLRRDATAGLTVVGACVPQPWQSRLVADEGVVVLGGLDDAVSALEQTKADAVLVAPASETAGQFLRNLSWSLEGSNIEVLVAPGVIEVAPQRMQVRPTMSFPLIQVREPVFRGTPRVVKSLFDRAMAATLLILTLPLFALLAVAVRCSSPGPVFYRHRRVGMRGQEFDLLKFRSMVTDADARLDALLTMNEGNEVQFKMRRDPRVTAVGRFLRRFSLDELPQLINVLRGDMSIVGPRPHVTREVQKYGADMHRRLLVKPGITGLWQVSGRSDLSWDESVELDVRYVENWSLSLDLSIIWRTGRAVLRASGAY